MNQGNKEWWRFQKWSSDYEKGANHYIENNFALKSQGNQIRCPCSICYYRFWQYKNVVRDHIRCNGFVPRDEDLLDIRIGSGRDEWYEHDSPSNMNDGPSNMNGGPSNMNDGMQDLLEDTMREGPNEEAKKFLKLVEEGQEQLYPGCKTFSRLSFIIRLFIYKCDHKLSNVAFTALLELLREVMPDAKSPKSFNEANKVIKVLGLDYTKIDACPNDCMLYWDKHAHQTSCHVCGSPRWKTKDGDIGETNGKNHKIPLKILRYFPIKKRMQRLYMCVETAKHMRWHVDGRENDGLLQHLADGQAWKDFDKLYPRFARDPRNVRLALATDGFNPFHSMSIVHSTWPVILVNYNLPPWMALKSEFLMLSLLIPGPLSPSNDICVYLQPLVKDLKELWNCGLKTYDASTNQRFDMHVALLSTISDFPGYTMLSGWFTKGKLACPCCHYETDSIWLDYSHKYCYPFHRRFLDPNHPWRYDKKNFNGTIDERGAPTRLKGVEIEELLQDFPNEFGKKEKRMRQAEDDPNSWRKFPILYELPYWKHCSNRHNLDAMHIEKNVFDIVIGTLLGIPRKTKDHEAARKDLRVLGMMSELQPKRLDDGSEELPTSSFWMSKETNAYFVKPLKMQSFHKVMPPMSLEVCKFKKGKL